MTTQKFLREQILIYQKQRIIISNNNSVGEFRRSDRLKNRPPVSYFENDYDEFLSNVLSAQNVLNSLPKCYSDI